MSKISIEADLSDPTAVAGLRNFLAALQGSLPDTEQVTPILPAPRRPYRRRIRPEEQTWEGFRASLTDQHRTFLAALEERKQLTLPQAVTLLGFTNPKSIGGLLGAMNRKARNRGVKLPFRATENQRGDRMWVWEG